MEQAKLFVCKSCSTPVPTGHKFCGRCGAAVPTDVLAMKTSYYGALQAPGRAKVVFVRGEGVEGVSYQLNADEHVIGRSGHLVLADDPFVSPRHANLFYREGHLVARDEESHNGVFLRVRAPQILSPGDLVFVGEQLLRVELAQPAPSDDADGVTYYTSPHHPGHLRVVQVLEGGVDGAAVVRADSVTVGREGVDMCFIDDHFVSGEHCRITLENGAITVTDLGSRNGTFVRISGDQDLSHGDYLFIGRNLLRVEITT